MQDRFKISRLLLTLIEGHGVERRRLAVEAGLPRSCFEQEPVELTTRQLFAMWRALEALSPDPALGLELGAEVQLERYDPVAIAAVCSTSFRDALARIARYKQLVCPEEIRVGQQGDQCSVEFVFIAATEEEPEILVDLCLARMLAIAKRGTAKLRGAQRLELTRAEGHRELLEEHFGCPVHFGSSGNRVYFREEDLDLPFVTHNRELLQILEGHLETELEDRTRSLGIQERVSGALVRSLAGRRPTLREVAEELGLSARTLQRRLAEEGSSFQEQVERARRQLAHHYLARTTVELKQTAFLLGFEDSNSFFRAFQAWEGTTPRDWRERHQRAEAR